MKIFDTKISFNSISGECICLNKHISTYLVTFHPCGLCVSIYLVPLRLDDQEKEPGSENKVVLDPGRGNPVLGIDE